MKTPAEIEAEVVRLSEHIATPDNAYPTFGCSANLARPHIEIGGDQRHYIAVEWGTEVFRKSASNLDELLYWIFDDVTFSMVCAYKSEHRIPEQDFQRLTFSKRVKLLTSVDPDTGRRGKKQTAETSRSTSSNDDRA